MPEHIETVKAKNSGMCFRCGQQIYVGDDIILGVIPVDIRPEDVRRICGVASQMPIAYHLQCKLEEIHHERFHRS